MLETAFENDEGAVRIPDCMPIRDKTVDIVRIVEGLRGRVTMRIELVAAFDYGSTVSWVHTIDGGCSPSPDRTPWSCRPGRVVRSGTGTGLTEWEASWLPGYDASRPVRIGNAASEQIQPTCMAS